MTGDDICGEEYLTVVWIFDDDITFRGSPEQYDPLTQGSTAVFNAGNGRFDNVVGKKIYPPWQHITSWTASWQMETKWKITPNIVFPNVQWDIGQELSGVAWVGTDPIDPQYWGWNCWEDDKPPEEKLDVIQDASLKELFFIDDHGGRFMTAVPGCRRSQKGKLRCWAEIKIGGNWYVCSNYKFWRMIMHIKCPDENTGWIEDTTKVNEVVEGTIGGWAGEWDE